MSLKIKRDGIHDKFREKGRRRRDGLAELSEAVAASPKIRNDLSPDLLKQIRPIDAFKVPGRRVRAIDKAQRERLKGAIQTFGFVQPLLIKADGTIIDGVTRWEAARDLGLIKLPCLVVDHLSDAEVRLLRITVNRLGETGGWEIPELKLEFDELVVLDAPPLEITGFSLPQIDIIRQDEDASAAEALDQTPEVAAVAVSRLGDSWRLGRHRLVCGDACDGPSYQALMAGATAQLVLTDVPYNVPIAGHVSSSGHREFAMASGEMSRGEFVAFNQAWMGAAAEHLADGGLLTTFIDWRGLDQVQAGAAALELTQLNLIVWTKTNGGMGSLWRSQHELLPVFKKGEATHRNNVALGRHGRWRSNVWSYPGASSLGSDARAVLKDHPTPKPVAMLADALLDVTNPDEIVLDPFTGSGSTLIAAETTSRQFRGIEIDPLYVDVAIRRWMRLTGEPAILEESGKTFAEVEAERAGDAVPEADAPASDSDPAPGGSATEAR